VSGCPTKEEEILKNEKDVKKAVKKVLDSLPKCWYFMPPANGYGRSGIPDFIGSVNGHLFAVETKFGKNDLSANQVREVHALIQNNNKVWITRETSVDSFDVEIRAWAELCS